MTETFLLLLFWVRFENHTVQTRAFGQRHSPHILGGNSYYL